MKLRAAHLLSLYTLTFHCFAGEPIRPDPKLSPGAIITPEVPIAQLCTIGYANKINGGVRDVPESEKKAVFKEYGIDPKSDKFEVDHLISLELGGSNDIKNLWPQSYTTQPWNAHVKDKLEDFMAASVRHCLASQGPAAAVALLHQYQREIATDWIAAFCKYLPGQIPAGEAGATSPLAGSSASPRKPAALQAK